MAIAIAACKLPPESAPPTRWKAKLGQDDRLVGKILDAKSGSFISELELRNRLLRTDFLLLGEKHDNPDHHDLQAQVIQSFMITGDLPTIAFEMLSEDDRPALEAWRKQSPRNVDALGEALDWSHSGWPPWEIYRPVFAATVARQLPIEPANLSKRELARLRRSGIAELGEEAKQRLALDPPLPAAARESLASEIREGHCGVADDAMVDAMIDVQRVRDATLADALIRVGAPAVLIAGAGHVRKDRAVPLYLARRAPERKVVSIAFVEVGHDAAAQAELVRDFDFVWFTPRVDDLDPCDRFREELEKLRGHAAYAP